MSHTQSPGAADVARQTARIIKGAGARLAGKSRGDSPVRRHSYDEADGRAQLGRRIGDGSIAQGIVHREALLDTAHEVYLRDLRTDEPNRLRKADLMVLRALLHWLDYRTGRLDPSHARIARRAGTCRNTVVAAMPRLRAHGLLEWVRRTCRAATAGGAGPQRQQISNAYHFEHRAKMTPGVWHRYVQLLGRRLARLRAGKTLPPAAPPPTATGELARSLARLGAAVQGAST